MLDQNTDRMWYVIGAVIIGAAIILILNGTAPQLFASIADTFQEKTEEVTAEINEISPGGNYGEVYLENPDFSKGATAWEYRSGTPVFNGDTVVIPGGADIWTPVDVRPEEVVQVQFKARGVGIMNLRFGSHNTSQQVSLSDDFQNYSVVVPRTEGNQNLLFMLQKNESGWAELDDIRAVYLKQTERELQI